MPAHIRDVFVVAADITPEEHVAMQAAMQRFVSNSISKTCNFPATASEDDVAKAFMLAWELGCKGLTVYVSGSREKVVLETVETAKKREEAKAPAAEAQPTAAGQPAAAAQPVLAASPPSESKPDLEVSRPPETKPDPAPRLAPVGEPAVPAPLPLFGYESKKPRARVLPGYTYRLETPMGTMFVTVNENGDDEPFEVFMHTAKAGSETAAISEAIGRLISYILRLLSPVPPHDRLKEIVRQLEGIGGGRSLGLGPNRVRSLPDGIAQVLVDYLHDRHGELKGSRAEDDDPSAPPPGQLALKFGDLCPECGQAAVVNEEGCRKCYACGYSEC